LGLLARQRGHEPAVAQHADAVGQRLDLREPVRHVEDRRAARAQPADEGQQALGLGRGQRARRLVEDQRARAGADRGRDLHELLLRGAQRRERRGDVERRADLGQPAARELVHGAPVDEQSQWPAARPGAKPQVLGHREVGAEGELLVHHGHAGGARVGRRAQAQGPAVERERALVGRVDAGQDAPERRLAGPVLADERVALAALDRQAHRVERARAAEALADGGELDAGHAAILRRTPLGRRGGPAGSPPRRSA
jgi:hypothetical protein